jgi:hypothetical protein
VKSQADHRVFGFTESGHLRVNLHNGLDSQEAGAMYSWVVCATVDQLAGKLEHLWEQPLSDDEFEVLEELEASNSESRCSRCNGSNVALESYDFGTDQETGYSDSGEALHYLDCGAREEYPPEPPRAPRKPVAPAGAAPRVAA